MRPVKVTFKHTFDVSKESLRIPNPWSDYELQPQCMSVEVYESTGYAHVELQGYRVLKKGGLSQHTQHVPLFMSNTPGWVDLLKEEARKLGMEIMRKPLDSGDSGAVMLFS